MNKNNDFFNAFLNGTNVSNQPTSTPSHSETESKNSEQIKQIDTHSEPIEEKKESTPKTNSQETSKNKTPKHVGVTVKMDEKYERYVNPNRKRNIYLLSFCAGFGVFCIIYFVIFGNKVDIPDFSNYSPSQTAQWASKNDMMIFYQEEYNDEIPKGQLISQQYESGESIKKGNELTLVMSLGVDPEVVVQLPEFDENWTELDLTRWVEENKLINTTIKPLADEDIEKDRFIKSELENDVTEFKRKTKLTLYVSTGSPFMVDMIDLSTKTEVDITNWANRNGVVVTFESICHDTIPEGQVIGQSIETGVSFNPKKEELTIQLSAGPGIVIPNLYNMTIDEMNMWAGTYGVTINLTEKYHNTTASNTIISTNVNTGDIIKKDQIVEVTVSLGKIGLTNFMGQSEIEFMSWIDEQNQKGAKLAPKISYIYSDEAEKNKILAQSLFDRRVEIGSSVQIVVSLGKYIQVPNLIGLTESTAREKCSESGLVCVFTYESHVAPKGSIASQDKNGGSGASEGDILNIIISNGE
ncbi:MAG TPA: penicillin-binding protein [Firmicutes bacterium]|nr:penicillin-binding protein [Bacillota bacterium]